MNRNFFGLFGIAIIAVCLFIPGYAKVRQLKHTNADLQEKTRRLAEENQLLEKELSMMEKDQLYQEKILREKLGVVRKDEIPLKMVPRD
jgi:cell division protein FtsB